MKISLELGVYLTIVVGCLIHLYVAGYTYSLQFDVGGRFDGHAPGLRQGWLFGRKVDLSDIQWREFRSSIPALALVFSLFAILSRLLVSRSQTTINDIQQQQLTKKRAIYYTIFAFAFLSYLHGVYVFYIFALVTLNWLLAQHCAGTRYGFTTAWLFSIFLLLSIRIWNGFPPSFLLGHSFSWLDEYQGVMRWYISFNLTVLRMLSYWVDLHLMRTSAKKMIHQATTNNNNGGSNNNDKNSTDANKSKNKGIEKQVEDNNNGVVGTPKEKEKEKEEGILIMSLTAPPKTAKERQKTPLVFDSSVNEKDGVHEYYYSLIFCMAHSLYAPLYLAGPIITYQDFTWQLLAPSAEIMTSKNILKYARKLAADLICIEILTHTLYFNSLAVHKIGQKYKIYGLSYQAAEVGLIGWWVLSFMWLKFATIWRTFRFFSLLDGIDPPENMSRCFANNYDIEGFWKGWHASFNKWLVRYLYIPLGGNSRRILVIWPIFFFVAVWHDLEWRLMSWAWLICFAFLPEMAAKQFARSKYFDAYRQGSMFRVMCGCAAALNIAALMIVNMVGFVVGTDGMRDLFVELFASPTYVVTALGAFYCGAQVIFAYREIESIQ